MQRLVERERLRKALVTGGAGYVGSHVVWQLVEAGWQVVVVDDLSTGRRANLPGKARLIVDDIASSSIPSIIDAFRPDIIFHFAAKTKVDESIESPQKYWHENVEKSIRFFKACVAGGTKHYVLSSTAAVYGDQAISPVSEDRPCLPLSPYGTTKLATEWLLKDFCAATGSTYIILRYFNVAGADALGRAGPGNASANLISLVADAMVGLRKSISIFGTDYPTADGTCIRDFIHVCDLATIHVLAADALLGGAPSNILNCGYGHGYSVRQIVDRALSLSDFRFDVVLEQRRKGDIVEMVADPTRLRRYLAWTARHDDIDAILLSAARWAASRGKSGDPPRGEIGLVESGSGARPKLTA